MTTWLTCNSYCYLAVCFQYLDSVSSLQLPQLPGVIHSIETPACAAGVWMAYCMVAYIYVMYSMGKMLQSAISESADSSQRQGLLFIYYGTVIIWSTFAVVWFGQEFAVLSVHNAELGNMLANFSAKVGLKPSDLCAYFRADSHKVHLTFGLAANLSGVHSKECSSSRQGHDQCEWRCMLVCCQAALWCIASSAASIAFIAI